MTQQHKPTLLEQATLTDADYERIVDPMMDVLEEEGTRALNADEPVDIRSVIRTASDAATRKAFEVLEQWMEEKSKDAESNAHMDVSIVRMIAGVYQQLRNELHAQLQA